MKILVLFLLIGIVGCENTGRGTKRPTIRSIEVGNSKDHHIVKYILYNDSDCKDYDIKYFYDSVGKFNIGDTIKITK